MDRFSTRSYIHVSLAVGLFAGFGLGTAAFVLASLGVPVGMAWPVLAQAHGHAQLFGFAGLMVLGVALVFLPRLRGAPLAEPQLVPWVLLLYGGGVLLRLVAQVAAPLLASAGQGRLLPLVAAGLPVGGAFTLCGAALATALLARTALTGPSLAQRSGLLQVLPLLAIAWLGLLAALLANVVGALEGWRAGALPSGAILDVGEAPPPWLIPPAYETLTVNLALLGWLVPMSVAFAARNFPLFLAMRPAPHHALAGGLATLVAGLLMKLGAGSLGARSLGAVAPLGELLTGGALLWLTASIGVFGPKAQLPGRMRDVHEAARAAIAGVALTDAFAWLAVAGVLSITRAALPLFGVDPPPEDGWRHALGAGFVLLLITGMALRLIPGFAGGGRDVDLRAARAAVRAARIAALLRVGPPLAVWLLSALGFATTAGQVVSWLLGAAGVAGAVALAALWLALRPSLTRPGRAAESMSG